MPLQAIYKPEPASKRWAHRLLPYLVVLASSAAALGLTLISPAILERSLFLFFFAATAVCAWFYGLAPGVTSVAVNGFALVYFVLPTIRPFRLADPYDWARFAIFVLASWVLASILAKLRDTQQAFRLSEERFHLAHEVARIWAWEVDVATAKVTWSSSPGTPAESSEESAQMWLQRIHPADRERVASAMKRADDTHKPYEIEFRVVLPQGETRWLASSGEFYRNQRGEQRMIGVNVDITSRKQAEENIEAAAKGQMAGELAHQINNPLQGLTHALYLLRPRVAQTDAQHYSAIAESEAARVAQLVQAILRLYARPGVML